MAAFISENLSTIGVGAAVLGIIALALARTILNIRKGGSPCGCGCERCVKPHRGKSPAS
ncbi:MAG: FeoB-associated Cys-rich membrane protein [Treponema sp.]|nr:FeoB-associated Cys-rich membrane protein [Treponema sp.]